MLAKCWRCDNYAIGNGFKVRDYYHITPYRALAYKDCNIKFKLNHIILVVFQNLENYDSKQIQF